MKKFTIMLVLVGVILCLVPIRVDAAVSYDPSGDAYLSSADLSLGKYGTIKAGDGQYVYVDQANGIKEWTFYLTVAEDTTSIYLGLVPSAIEIQNIKVNESDFLKVFEKEVDGVTNVLLTATTSGGIKADSRVKLFTVTTKDLASEQCVLAFSPLAINPCDVIEGNYYDDKGNLVSKVEYDKVCSDKTVTIPDEENPQTGSVIPYVAIGGGMLAIAGVFLYSRKSNKMYKL